MESAQQVRRIAQERPHVVVAEQLDGSVAVQSTRQPRELLARLGSSVTIHRTAIRPGTCAPQVVHRIRARLPGGASEFVWHPADFEDVIALLDEYDLDTGAIVQRHGIRVKAPVYVDGLGRGVVQSFTQYGRALVKLDKPVGGVSITAIAPRSRLKPVVRAGEPS